MTEDSFGKRLQIVVDIVGSAAALSRKTSISASVIKGYIEEVNDPTRKKLVAMAEAAQVSVEWLATGKGPMRPEEKRPVPTQVNHLEDPLIRDIKLWIRDMTSEYPGWRTWFETELSMKIPAFNEWRKKNQQTDSDGKLAAS